MARRMLGWSMLPAMSAQLVPDALIMALWRRPIPSEWLHRSDAVTRYVCERFQRLLVVESIAGNLIRRGDCRDTRPSKAFSLRSE
jgi:putative transposase